MVTNDVARGVAVSPKGRWAKLSPDGRTVNWLTSDDVTDFGLQAIYHSNLVRVRPAREDETDAVAALGRVPSTAAEAGRARLRLVSVRCA